MAERVADRILKGHYKGTYLTNHIKDVIKKPTNEAGDASPVDLSSWPTKTHQAFCMPHLHTAPSRGQLRVAVLRVSFGILLVSMHRMPAQICRPGGDHKHGNTKGRLSALSLLHCRQ